jgi:transcriptional regulator with XRE-family HTH domain
MATPRVDSAAVAKRAFGDLVHAARAERNLSLRRLANLSGIDYSRLSRIETGTRPAPDLASIRTLANILTLDLGELLVAAGTSRSVVEDLVWSERVRLGRAVPDLGAYRPGAARLAARNTFDGHVEERHGALCTVRVGNVLVRVLSFAEAPRLRLVVPPETVWVEKTAPRGLTAAAATILPARVVKARPMGQLVNLVLAADGVELNALHATDRSESGAASGDPVYATLLTAAIQTSPLEEESCEAS